ncbi:MAG: NigD-like protein [Prevotella sp.]|nr:NigD-like protein [Prevotella sp.]
MKKFALFIPLLFFIFSCSTDGYDTGDGPLSNMRADFVEAQTNSFAYINKIETDDGETLSLTKSPSALWASKPDTVYRALLYYNKVLSSSGSYQAEPITISQIPVPTIHDISDLEEGIITDPVTFSSAWKSKNGKYINLDLYLKLGSSDDTSNQQLLGIVYNGSQLTDNGNKHINLRLYHSQNGVPEYYSSETYLSIPITSIPDSLSEGDEVEITINTYDGEITKSFVI